MNLLALVVALAALGGDDDPVNYLVETTADKQQQYTLQIKPEILRLVASGEEIHSDVPFDAAQVQRLCIRIGMAKQPRTPTGEAAFRSLVASASRWASTDRRLTPADDPPTILWTARADPQPLYGLRYGYQPDAEGKLAYFVQLDPAVLRTLAAGDEIYAPIDPAAGRPDRFVVSIAKKELPPRVAPQQAVTPLPLAPAPTQFQSPAQQQFAAGGQNGLTPLDGGRTPFPAAGSGGAFAPNNNLPSTNPPFGGFSSSPPLTGPQGPARANEYRPTEIPPAPGNFGGEYARQTPRLNSPATTIPPVDSRAGQFGAGGYSSAPPLQIADARGYPPGPSGRRDGGGDQSQLTPPPGSYNTQLPPANYPQQQGAYPPQQSGYSQQQGSGFGAPPPDRHASVPPQPGATLPPVTTTGSLTNPAASVAALAPQKETWGIFVVVLFALFFSIGGNLYLAWTALEFHNRYRSAIDRLRSAARNS